MKNLKLYFKDKEGKEIKPPVQLMIGDQPIQCKDFMDTDAYFQLTALNDDDQAKQAKAQGYFMFKTLIINPKVDDALIGKLPWDGFMKIVKALREEFLPEKSFLELGVQLDEPLEE